ncbi:hypothetical protein HDU92_003312 [Lobulomyces angularis]|nr:hypothetical protein HDU92_003312 [Lobulomyces angularis]
MEMQTDYVEFNPEKSVQRILCAQCAAVITPNAANLCVDCIRNDVDITEGIPKQATVHFCKDCERYLQPPNIWVIAHPESKELLSLCLKKLKGLNKVRLVDAGFIWTEPHSRRIKVKLTIQKEVYSSAILQQVFIVEYVVSTQQCDECMRVAAQLTWKASVQVRQKVSHKRTFFWLEQLILKHNAHKDTTNIKEAKDGIDFYYVNRSHAIKMLDYLQSVVPLKLKTSEQLISTDVHTSTSNYKFTFSAEIVPICKDDLVCLPTKLARQLGDISPIVVCYRVGNTVSLIDPFSLKSAEMRGTTYWENPFNSLCEAKDLVEFYIIDVQYENKRQGKYTLATVEVALSQDLSKTYYTRTHLGGLFNPGDHAMGYFLVNANFNNDNWDEYINRLRSSGHRQLHLGGGLPDLILVKKSYPNARKRNKGRNWRLKNLAKEDEDQELRGGKRQDKIKQEMDYEIFLRDLEEDSELRGMVNLFKDPRKDADHGNAEIVETNEVNMISGDEDEVEPEEDFPQINVDELLDDMDALALEDKDGEGDVMMGDESD